MYHAMHAAKNKLPEGRGRPGRYSSQSNAQGQLSLRLLVPIPSPSIIWTCAAYKLVTPRALVLCVAVD